MSNIPFGLNDFQTALNVKQQNLNTYIVVIIEKTGVDGNSFLQIPQIYNLFNDKILLVRIIENQNLEGFHDFSSNYHVEVYPSLFVFEPNSEIPKSFNGYFPPPQLFVSIFNDDSTPELNSNTENFYPTTNDISNTQNNTNNNNFDNESSPKQVKISLQWDNNSSTHTFLSDDTIKTLRTWIRNETNHISGIPIVTHQRQPLSSDENMTLLDAGLVPSAMIRIESGMNGPQKTTEPPSDPLPLPGQNTRNTGNRLGPQHGGRRGFLFWFKLIISLFNPWADMDNPEDFWEYEPHPDENPFVQVQQQSV